MAALGDVASSQAPPWPKNRLRFGPTDARLEWGLPARKTRQQLSNPVWAHSGTKARVWARRRPDPTVGAGATASLDCRVSHVRACAPVRLEIVNWGACLKIFG